MLISGSKRQGQGGDRPRREGESVFDREVRLQASLMAYVNLAKGPEGDGRAVRTKHF